MRKLRAAAQRSADDIYPPILRGRPHHMTREKQRIAFQLGFELGYRLAKANPNPDPTP